MAKSKGPELLLVNPSTSKEVYGKLSKNAAREVPFLTGISAGYVRKHGHSVEIFDANSQGLPQGETADMIKEINPGLIGILAHGHQPSASSQLMGAIGKLCEEIKGRTDTPILLSGVHPTSLPERTLREEACDFVVRGEVYPSLTGLLESGGDPKDVPGVCYLEDGNLVMNKSAPLIRNLTEELGDPAWDLQMSFDNFRTHGWHSFTSEMERTPFGALYTTLGCPYVCSFCCINAENKAAIADNPSGGNVPNLGGSDLERMAVLDNTKPTMRYWNPIWAVDQIEHMVNNGVRNIKIIDEMFVFNERHVGAIADEITRRGLGDSLNMWAYGRVDTVNNPELLEKLGRAGLNWICLGIESLSDQVRDGADKNYSFDDIIASVKRVDDAGINVLGNYIFGLPGDTMESMRETLKIALELKTPWYNGYAAVAYPGAPLYTMAKGKGIALPGDSDVPGGWTAYSHHSFDSLPLPTDTLSSADVVAFRDFAFHKYIEHEPFLRVLDERFGPGPREHLAILTQHKIDRRALGGKNAFEYYGDNLPAIELSEASS